MRVVVMRNAVCDGDGLEDLDTRVQAEAVAGALRSLGHEADELAVDSLDSAAGALGKLRPEVVFNLVERLDGSDAGAVKAAAMLDGLGLAYTGSPAMGLTAAAGKVGCKRILARAGLPTPEWYCPADLAEGGPRLRGDFILKSVWEHASFGLDQDCLAWVWDREDLAESLAARAETHGGDWFAERYVSGREFNVSLLESGEGLRALPVAEICFADWDSRPRIVGWEAKWSEGSFAFARTPRRFDFPESDGPLLAELGRLALECARVFGLRGYARVDFRVDGSGRPFIIDVNANPCLSPDAGFAAALARAGLDYARTMEALARLALDETETGGLRAA